MSSLTFAFAPMFDGTSFIIVSLLSRFFQGVGGAGIATSIVAIMSMLYREKLEEIFGIQQSLTGASMIIGPVIGMGLNLIGGFSFIFYSFSAVFFTGFLYLYFVLPPDEVTLESSNPVTWKQMLSVKVGGI
jgi:MFS family permease